MVCAQDKRKGSIMCVCLTLQCMAVDRQAAKHQSGPDSPPPTSFLPCLAPCILPCLPLHGPDNQAKVGEAQFQGYRASSLPMSCLFSPLMAAVVWSTAPTLFTLLHRLLDNQERVGAHFQGRMAGVPISCLFSFSDWGSVVVGVSWTRKTHRFLLLCLSYKWPWPKNQGKLECAFIQKLHNTACCWHQEEDLTINF